MAILFQYKEFLRTSFLKNLLKLLRKLTFTAIMSVRIFEGKNHANVYSKFRPTVPEQVLKVVLNYLECGIPSNEWQIAVDVGCGSGQGTNLLAKYFKKSYGFDVSPAQINEAKVSQHSDNVFYDVSPAETLPSIKTDSVQLLTAFEAAHWFDLDQFFHEADRVVRNNGVVAFIGYHNPEPSDPDFSQDKRLTQLVTDAYFDSRVAPYKNPKIIPIENHYRDFRFPENYEFVHKDNIRISYQSNAKNVIGFIESWSLYQGLVKNDKELAQKYKQEFEENLKNILKTDKFSEKELIVTYDYFIAMGRKISNKDQNNNY